MSENILTMRRDDSGEWKFPLLEALIGEKCSDMIIQPIWENTSYGKAISGWGIKCKTETRTVYLEYDYRKDMVTIQSNRVGTTVYCP